MNIAIFGMGYVGMVTAACLAEDGHTVQGVDVSTTKIDLLGRGACPIVEDSLPELVAKGVNSGNLSAVLESEFSLVDIDLVIVCVGTPSAQNGSLNTQYVEEVAKRLAGDLKKNGRTLNIVIRSTVLPGTVRSKVLNKFGGYQEGTDFNLFFHPEFLREGSSVADYYNPPKIIVGELIPGTAEKVMNLYDSRFTAPRMVCTLEEAEMVKYGDNIFHALKVSFANEMGQICKHHGIDSQKVMEMFCEDRKLNISPKYLRPGFAFGGSCLPKDLRAFLYFSRQTEISTSLLDSILVSNHNLIQRALDKILETGKTSLGFYGIAFKQGTDDLRESPYVELAERLLGKGRELKFFDPFVHEARIIGGNQSYIQNKLPHLSKMLIHDFNELTGCDLIVTCHVPSAKDTAALKLLKKPVMDLSGLINIDSEVMKLV